VVLPRLTYLLRLFSFQLILTFLTSTTSPSSPTIGQRIDYNYTVFLKLHLMLIMESLVSSSSESLTSRSTESMEIDTLSLMENSPPRYALESFIPRYIVQFTPFSASSLIIIPCRHQFYHHPFSSKSLLFLSQSFQIVLSGATFFMSFFWRFVFTSRVVQLSWRFT